MDTRALSPGTGWLQGRAACARALRVLALAAVHSILVLWPQTHSHTHTCFKVGFCCLLGLQPQSSEAVSPIFEV